jgi:signal transduction histidine kinase
MLVSAAPVFAADGTPDTAVSVFLDMTRVKEVDQVKDDFLSMVTHDLRSPLATIKGLNAAAIGAFREGSRDEVRGLLESMDEEADYLTELVSNLLDMSRIEAGADIFDLELCHLADISHDIVARLRRSREGRGRDIHLNVPASLPPVFADPAQIGRVVANLMSNALKYSDGDIEVTASFDPERRRIRVEIKDRGPGIPEDQQSIIFDKFGRLKTGKTRGREGSGLGLAICKSIVESHHGEIGVISVPGRGSTFWFDVPAEPDGK